MRLFVDCGHSVVRRWEPSWCWHQHFLWVLTVKRTYNRGITLSTIRLMNEVNNLAIGDRFPDVNWAHVCGWVKRDNDFSLSESFELFPKALARGPLESRAGRCAIWGQHPLIL
jgi:hypothetical protein